MKKLLIESRPTLDRVAFLEDGKLAEIHYEDKTEISQVGNVYLGVVQNVLPAMNAAFIDIGQEKNAYMNVAENAIPVHAEVLAENKALQVHKGDRILVQVLKEAAGSKGPRVSTQISLTGRYLVLGAGANFIALSRKIYEPEERKRVDEILHRIRPDGFSLIARTVAAGAPEEELCKDLEMLMGQYYGMLASARKVKPPVLLFQEAGLIQRTLKDLYPEQADEIWVENCPAVQEWVPAELRSRIRLADYDLFESHGVEPMVDRALQRKVWLKSGGNIFIDAVEAMTVIDVNSGKYVGREGFEETVTRINIEAAHEIAHQLRLRDIGGIIIVDFIDMEDKENEKRVIEALEEALKKDRTKSQIMGFSPLGILQLTRKKMRQQLSLSLTEPCRLCEGAGRVMSAKALSWRAAQQLVSLLDADAPALILSCAPALAEQILKLGVLQKELEGCPMPIYLQPVPGMDWQELNAHPLSPGIEPPDVRWLLTGEDLEG